MAQVLIRNLDDGLIEDYRRAAIDNGQSLESELRAVLAEHRPRRRMTRDELVALSRSLRTGTPERAASVDSTASIRADRDSR